MQPKRHQQGGSFEGPRASKAKLQLQVAYYKDQERLRQKTKNRFLALIEAKAALFNYKQSLNQSTHDYCDTFKELLSILESYDGKLHDPIEAVPNVLAKANALNDDEKDKLMRDHYTAAIFIIWRCPTARFLHRWNPEILCAPPQQFVNINLQLRINAQRHPQ
jgi:hypothetical protein